MQVSHPSGTLPPWLSSSWLNAMPTYNELLRRQIQREHSRIRDHLQPAPGLTLYAYGPYGRNPQPIFRFGGFPGVKGSGNGATAAGSGNWSPFHQFDPIFTHSGDLSRIPGVLVRGARPPLNMEWEIARDVANSGTPAGPYLGHGSSAEVQGAFALSPRATLRAWLFGTALVVLVVVLVRAIDKCLDLNLLKSRRRSQEWPTPSVRATNRQAPENSAVIMPEEEFSSTDRPADYSEVISVDLPPPYSECLRDEQIPDPGRPKLDYEEPPPDYNDTYVEFSNKNGVASVLIYSARRTPLVNRREISGTSANNDNNVENEQGNVNQEEPNTSTARNDAASNGCTSDSRQSNLNVQVIKYVIKDDMPAILPETTNTDTIECDDDNNSEQALEATNEERNVVV